MDKPTMAEHDLETVGASDAIGIRPQWAYGAACDILHRTYPDGLVVYQLSAYKTVMLTLEIADALVEAAEKGAPS